jgi:hypothetical protein
VEYEQREKARKTERARAKGPKHKPLNRVIMEATATVVPDAQGTLDAAMRRYGPDASRRSDKFKITDGEATGQTLRLRFDYTVKGGHPADVKRALERC